MTDQDMKNLESLFQRYIGVLTEDFQSKLDLVVEGHTGIDRKIDQKFDQLSEKIDHNSFMIKTLNKKIDSVDERLSQKLDTVAADLKAHRSDTEAHHGVYQVKER
jgi:outer membrane murein-binding lipoprotein Lpp